MFRIEIGTSLFIYLFIFGGTGLGTRFQVALTCKTGTKTVLI
jgi:hypothetical protein